MKCPKCGYSSFPYLENCRKCGHMLTEQRATFGVYALRPDPPDLLLAYQAADPDLLEATQSQPVTAASLDLGQLDKIELELGEAEPLAPSTDAGGEQVGATPDERLTLDAERTGEGEFPAGESSPAPLSSPEISMPQSLDLSRLEGVPFEVDNEVPPEANSAEGSRSPKEAATEPPVYDLDLDEEHGGLTLQPLENGSESNDMRDDEEVAEYTLEIDDEVEFEIDEDELELEQNDDAEAEDDDER